MAILQQAVTVTTVATRLDLNTESTQVSDCHIFNEGANTVYLGNSGVSTGNGFPLAVGEVFAVALGRNEGIYGVVAAATESVRVIEVGVS